MQQSDVVLHLGRLMLAAGAGSYRIKSSMARAASAVGLDRHEATVTMTEIVTSSYVGNRFRTEACEVRWVGVNVDRLEACLLYTSPSPRDVEESRMPSSA